MPNGLLGTTRTLFQHGKPQREDDGIGALQRVAVVDGDDRRPADRRSQRSCRLAVGAREPQSLATRGELAGDGRSDPSSADDRGGHGRNLLGATVLTSAAQSIGRDDGGGGTRRIGVGGSPT
jgi:hypothetical protein